MKTKPFRPVRPLRPFDSTNPIPFDPRTPTFTPLQSIHDDHITDLNSRKIRMFGVKVYNSGTQSIADDGSYHDVVWDTAEFDQGDLWTSDDSETITIKYAGVWIITGYVAFAADVDGIRRLRLVLNGSTNLQTSMNPSMGAATETPVFISAPLLFDAGDTIKLQARQNSGAALNILGGSDDNFFSAIFQGVI